MITLEDCVGLSGLTLDEIDAIAEHEHIPEAVAVALGSYLLHKKHGNEIIRDMIRDDIRVALQHHDRQHAANLLATLRTFLSMHPVT